ncbi:MAG TPA: NAD(P)H-binding protein, partial [Chloroflexota bacterium]|nr:NAD(P)H-binding protein [Chloroflexota bacterium]
MNVLVTGGTGDLGRIVVRKLAEAGHTVRSASRHTPREPLPDGVSWARLDLETGEGLEAALEDVDTIVHAATNPTGKLRQTDVEGTRGLLERARAAGVQHVVFISIVGIDRVPQFFYYKVKLEAERVVRESGVPYTILRATQFPEFFERLLTPQLRLPALLVPTDFKSQPVDAEIAADALVEFVERGPRGLLPDLAGPEVLTLGEIARAWRDARGLHKPIIHLPVPGKAAQGFRSGGIIVPDRPTAGPTYADWLERKYGNSPSRRAPSPAAPLWARLIVTLIGLSYGLAGAALLWATPWFYEHVGHFPPYNRHYAGDAGAFNLPIGLGLLWAARGLRKHRPLIVIGIIASVLH